MKDVFKIFVSSLYVLGFNCYSGEKEKGLVGWWRFDEKKGYVVKDYSGLGNHGKIFKAKRVTGKFGGALSFEEKGSYVKIPCSPNLNLGDALTLEAWIYPKDISEESRVIISKNDEYILRIDRPSEGNKISFFVHVGSPAVSWEPRVSSIEVPSLNEWHHIVGVWDGENLYLYVNGNLVNKRVRIGKPNPNPYPVMIGNWEYPSCHGTNFGGIIDEVRIYNRALSEEEIKLHYEKERGNYKD